MKDFFQNSPALADLKAAPQRFDYETRVQVAPDSLRRFAGTYSPDNAPNVRFRVEATACELIVHNPGQPPATLYPESATVFRIAPDRGQVSFQLSATGDVEGLTLHKQIDLVAKRVQDTPSASK